MVLLIFADDLHFLNATCVFVMLLDEVLLLIMTVMYVVVVFIMHIGLSILDDVDKRGTAIIY